MLLARFHRLTEQEEFFLPCPQERRAFLFGMFLNVERNNERLVQYLKYLQ